MLTRANLSGDVKSNIAQMILDGRLPAAGRINEVRLAETLGVSRTPLREALQALTADNIVTCRPRHGFYVAPLSEKEFIDIYSIRPILDPAALKLSGLPTSSQLSKLEALNAKLKSAKSVNQAIALDDAWHFELISNCPNEVLLEMIDDIIRRTRRYELAYLREEKNLKVAATEHEAIMEAVRAGSMQAACSALRKNLTSGKQPILNWLRDQS